MCVLHFNANLQDSLNFKQHVCVHLSFIRILFRSPVRLQVWYLLWTLGGFESWRQLPYVDSREHFIFQSSQKISVCLSEPSMFKLKRLSGSVSQAPPRCSALPLIRAVFWDTWGSSMRGGLRRLTEMIWNTFRSPKGPGFCRAQNFGKLATSGVPVASRGRARKWAES